MAFSGTGKTSKLDRGRNVVPEWRNKTWLIIPLDVLQVMKSTRTESRRQSADVSVHVFPSDRSHPGYGRLQERERVNGTQPARRGPMKLIPLTPDTKENLSLRPQQTDPRMWKEETEDKQPRFL